MFAKWRDKLSQVNLGLIAVCMTVLFCMHLHQEKFNSDVNLFITKQYEINDLICKKSETDTKIFKMLQQEILQCQKQ